MTSYSEPYSKRKRKQDRSGQPVVYQYDQFPDTFRMQVFYALTSAIGSDSSHLVGLSGASHPLWDAIDAKLRREHGLEDLSPSDVRAHYKWRTYLRRLSDADLIIDAIEIPFAIALRAAANQEIRRRKEESTAHVLHYIDELNRRFREHDLGYEFIVAGDSGFVTRVDSQYVHSEVVEPAIANLYASGFQGPLDEFVAAHREYRRGNYKAAMNEAHKAFESTMKAICSARGWDTPSNPTSSVLVKTLIDNGLIPKENESYFNGLRTVLESGSATMRNRMSGHGQGKDVVELPDYFAALALHLAASTIVFLMAAHKANPTGSRSGRLGRS